MKGSRCRLLVVLIFFPFLFNSCSEKQDFDQFEDLSITPTLASGIFYLESDEATINAAGDVGVFYVQTINFDAFNEEFVAERLLEGTIQYELENTTTKRIGIAIEFLDENGDVLDVEPFIVEPNMPEVFTRDVFYGPGGRSIDILTTTSSLRIAVGNLSDSTSVSTTSDPKIKLSSGAEFLFRLK